MKYYRVDHQISRGMIGCLPCCCLPSIDLLRSTRRFFMYEEFSRAIEFHSALSIETARCTRRGSLYH